MWPSTPVRMEETATRYGLQRLPAERRLVYPSVNIDGARCQPEHPQLFTAIMDNDRIGVCVNGFRSCSGLLFLWLFSLSLPLGSRAAEPLSGALPSPGVFISAQYLQSLRATRSPLLAEGTRSVHAVLVQQVDSVSVSIMVVLPPKSGPSAEQIFRAF